MTFIHTYIHTYINPYIHTHTHQAKDDEVKTDRHRRHNLSTYSPSIQPSHPTHLCIEVGRTDEGLDLSQVGKEAVLDPQALDVPVVVEGGEGGAPDHDGREAAFAAAGAAEEAEEGLGRGR